MRNTLRFGTALLGLLLAGEFVVGSPRPRDLEARALVLALSAAPLYIGAALCALIGERSRRASR